MALESILQRLRRDPPILFDGAIGSRLIAMGLAPGQPPEAWVLEHPELLQQIHREYAAAGSEVIATCTFGANRLRLAKCGLQGQLESINRRAVEIAREAAGDSCWIAGDIGPTGEFLQPHGPLSAANAQSVYVEQIEVLAEAGVDLFLLETHYDLAEARICLEACLRTAPQIPVAALLTFNRTKRGYFTVMGDAAQESLQALFAEGAFLVGSNCTLEAAGMLELARELMCSRVSAPDDAKSLLPLLLQPNAGLPQMTPSGVQYPQGPEEFAGNIKQIVALGVRAVGGCCGTDNRHISAMRAVIQSMT